MGAKTLSSQGLRAGFLDMTNISEGEGTGPGRLAHLTAGAALTPAEGLPPRPRPAQGISFSGQRQGHLAW